jgi:aminotransferase
MTTKPAASRVARPPSDFLSDKVRSLQPSGIRRFFDMLAEMKDVISLTIGEPDFTTPEPITRAAIASLEAGQTHYTANGGMVELRVAIVEDLAARYGIEYDPRSELIITVGASEALDATLRAICDPGDEVIYHEPSFVAYAPCITLAGGIPVPISTGDETNFQLTAAQIEAAIKPRTNALILG